MATSSAMPRSARAYAAHVSELYGARYRPRARRHHRRLQPGLLRRHAGARQGRRCRDPAGALVFQSQDGARHARHRGRAAALPRRSRLRAGRRGGAAADRRRARAPSCSSRRTIRPARSIRPTTIARLRRRSARERGIALVIDETYRDFIGGRRAARRLCVRRLARRRSCSSTASRRPTAFPATAPARWSPSEPFISEIAKVMDTLQICAPRVPQLALPWAIEALADWRAANRAEICRARRGVSRKHGSGSTAGASARSAPTSPISSIRGRSASGSEVAEWLARERGVLALPGSYFGPGQERYLRVAFANVDAAALEDFAGRGSPMRPAPR